jgi:hypothetical protein
METANEPAEEFAQALPMKRDSLASYELTCGTVHTLVRYDSLPIGAVSRHRVAVLGRVDHTYEECVKGNHDEKALPRMVEYMIRNKIPMVMMDLPFWNLVKPVEFQQRIQVVFQLGRTEASYNLAVYVPSNSRFAEPGSFHLTPFGSYANTSRSVIQADLVREANDLVTADLMQCPSPLRDHHKVIQAALMRHKSAWNAWLVMMNLCPLCWQATHRPKAAPPPPPAWTQGVKPEPVSSSPLPGQPQQSGMDKSSIKAALQGGKLPPAGTSFPPVQSSRPGQTTWDDGTGDLNTRTAGSNAGGSRPAWKPKGQKR